MRKKFSIRSINRPTFFASLATVGLVATLSSFALTQLQTDEPTAIITTGELNVREGPGPGYLPITTVKHRDTVILLGRDPRSAWVHVQIPDGTIGWVTTLHIMTNYRVADLPVVTSTADPFAAITTGRLNMRTGPGINYPISMTITEGDRVSLLGRNSNGKWVLVRALGTYVGWINTGYIASAVPISSLPLRDATAEVSPPAGVVPYYGTGIAIPVILDVTAGPDPSSEVVTSLVSGTRFTLAGRNESMSRLKIATSEGQVGWVSNIDIGSSIPYIYLPVME